MIWIISFEESCTIVSSNSVTRSVGLAPTKTRKPLNGKAKQPTLELCLVTIIIGRRGNDRNRMHMVRNRV